MRFVTAVLVLIALSATNATAAGGHWYCTADGIRSWTSSPDAMDAKGWSYSGDRTAYKDSGHCAKS